MLLEGDLMDGGDGRRAGRLGGLVVVCPTYSWVRGECSYGLGAVRRRFVAEGWWICMGFVPVGIGILLF